MLLPQDAFFLGSEAEQLPEILRLCLTSQTSHAGLYRSFPVRPAPLPFKKLRSRALYIVTVIGGAAFVGLDRDGRRKPSQGHSFV